MLTILYKSIAIINSDTAEQSIPDSDRDTSKVSPDGIAIDSDNRY
jgi:hypothetical protein